METSATMVEDSAGVSLLSGWFGREMECPNLTWLRIPSRRYNRRIVIMKRQGSGNEVALNTFSETLIKSHKYLSNGQ